MSLQEYVKVPPQIKYKGNTFSSADFAVLHCKTAKIENKHYERPILDYKSKML